MKGTVFPFVKGLGIVTEMLLSCRDAQEEFKPDPLIEFTAPLVPQLGPLHQILLNTKTTPVGVTQTHNKPSTSGSHITPYHSTGR